MKMNRRDFLRAGGVLAIAAGMPDLGNVFAAGLKKIASQQTRVIWIEGQSCSGCSVSLLNSDSPPILEVLTDYMSMIFHPVVSAAQGAAAMELYSKTERAGKYILIVEGAIPLGMPEACVIGGQPLTSMLVPLIRSADYVIANGTCAAHGGIPAAEGNQTGSVSVREFMVKNNLTVEKKLIACPLCPSHPDSIVGMVAWLAGRGYPKVNPEHLTPDMYYKNSTHDDCPRFHYYNKGVFAKKFGDEGCLFKLGCLGFLSHTVCPSRQWNSGVNWCVRASAPCLACSSPVFAKLRKFPFYRKTEETCQPVFSERDRKGEKI
jgi:hydrogenase small subunit